MFIKNQQFKDEETLQEILFDFSLGDPTPYITQIKEEIENDLSENQQYQEYLSSLTDEEDRMELESEERLIRLSEALMDRFEGFKVAQQKFFGLKGKDEILLYSINLV